MPDDIYKGAGIDMASPAPDLALMARMNRVMDEIEALEGSGRRPWDLLGRSLHAH